MSRPINIHEQYRFFYDHPVNGETQCYPAINELVTEWVKEEGQIFYRKQIAQNFVFINNDKREITDFTDLYELDRSDDNGCEKIDFRIEIKCGEDWEEWYLGYIALVDGEFDVDRCVLSIPIRPADKYSCVFETWEQERNLLTLIPQRFESNLIIGEIISYPCVEIIQVTGDPGTEEDYEPATNCIENLPGFPSTFGLFFNSVEIIGSGDDYIVTINTTWQREEVETECDNGNPVPPPGGGWIMIEGCNQGNIGFAKWGRAYTAADTFDSIPNGKNLNDILGRILEDCELNLISNYLGINPDNSNPNNAEYDYAAQYYQELILHQITDVKKPDASQKAQLLIHSFKDLLDELRIIFNIYWDIDDDGNFILEHFSYFAQDNLMLNLTEDETKKYIQGKYKYTYPESELPREEKWLWVALSDFEDGDFDSGQIIYSGNCTTKGDEGVKEYKSQWMTNVAAIFNDPDKFPDNAAVLISTNQGVVNFVNGFRTGNVIVNGSLSFANLLHYAHKWNRYQKKGIVFGIGESEFKNYKRIREQEEITFPICCTDLINTFDPADLILTQLGWGENTTVRYGDPSGIMTIILRHR